jgi:hypothetical protein
MYSQRFHLRREPLPRDLTFCTFLLLISILIQFYASLKGVSYDFVRAPLLQLGDREDVTRLTQPLELDLDLNCAVYKQEVYQGRVIVHRDWVANTLESSSSSASARKLPPQLRPYLPYTAYWSIEEARSRFYFTQGCFRSFLRCVAEQVLLWAIVVFLPDVRSLRKLDIPSIQAMTLGCAIGRSIWSFMRYGGL